MRLKSAEYRQGERPEWLCHRRVGGRIPLPRTGGAPARAVRILEESAVGVKVSVRRSPDQVGGGRAIMSVIMAGVGVLACAAPARRALRVQPTEALRQG